MSSIPERIERNREFTNRAQLRFEQASSYTGGVRTINPQVPEPQGPVEWVIRAHLQRHSFTIAVEPLESMKAFMLSQHGTRYLVIADDLSATDRVFLYLHLLGHIALGHIDLDALSACYEYRSRQGLSIGQRLREYEADRWARSFARDLRRQQSKQWSTFLQGLDAAVDLHHTRNGLPRRLLDRWGDFMWDNWETYRKRRFHPGVEEWLNSVGACLGGTPQ